MHFINSGDKELGHSHPFDHLTLLTKGSLRITIEGQVTEFKAPHMIFIVKNKNHELIALEDDTLAYCIHALRDGDTVGDILDPTMVPNGAFTMELYQSLNITPLTNDNNNN
jgi:hypothetical protein